jgi:hypothetical protein
MQRNPPLPWLTMAQSWHTQSELVTTRAQHDELALAGRDAPQVLGANPRPTVARQRASSTSNTYGVIVVRVD